MVDAYLILEIKSNIEKGIQTIFVEGKGDKIVYGRFYPDAKFIFGDGHTAVIDNMREINKKFGLTPLIIGIIDKDRRWTSEIEALEEENIYALKTSEIEYLFLKEEVIRKTFGDEFFYRFKKQVCIEASIKSSTEVINYETAVKIICKYLSSKYCITRLMKELGKKNMNNSKNIDFLSKKMDQMDTWYLVTELIPDIRIASESKRPHLVNNYIKPSP